VQLDGIHHITCITVDAPGNVDFYARALTPPVNPRAGSPA
jgi:catechol 2,3-dioxygenase-like lactoylglutathione lyase family enzyme